MNEVIAKKVRDTNFDIVQIELAHMGQYVEALNEHPHTVLREYDLTFLHYARRVRTTQVLWRKLYHFIQWRRMRRYEIKVARRFKKVIVPSQQTKAQLVKHLPERQVEAIPFGITLPGISGVSPQPRSGGKRLLFVGAMGRPYNVESVFYFYEEIWPLITAEEPDAAFWIVGSEPPAHLHQLAERDNRIRVTGFVEDLTPYYLEADLFIAPLTIGGGVVTKILDALAMARAVVTTSVGNEGIGAQDGRDLIIADTPQAFAGAVVALLRSSGRRHELGLNGREFVRREFGWSGIIRRFEDVYQALVKT
jgi:glycosyltransferase involved in cell wall biosynthesis